MVSSGRLSRDQVVATAVELAGREGLARLSMRQLAGELGVEAMSLYHHVRNKEDLLDACIERVSDAMEIGPMLAAGPWRERLIAGEHAYRELGLAYPEFFPHIGHRPVRTLRVLRPVEAALSVLADAGFGPASAIRALRVLNSFSYGYVMSELTGLAVTGLATAGLAEDETVRQRDFPQLAAALPLLPDTDRTAEFERGVRTVLDGIDRWPRG